MTEGEAIKEAREAVQATQLAKAALEVNPVIDGEVLTAGLSQAFRDSAAAQGLTSEQISAGIVLAMGFRPVQAAAQSMVSVSKIKSWLLELPFQAFVNQLTLAYTEDIRAEGLRVLASQVRGDKDRVASDKDIFDWVKLALTAGSSGTPRKAGDAPPTLHQHLHVHSSLSGQGETGGLQTDNANLLTLQRLAAGIGGDKQRKLAEILRDDS